MEFKSIQLTSCNKIRYISIDMTCHAMSNLFDVCVMSNSIKETMKERNDGKKNRILVCGYFFFKKKKRKYNSPHPKTMFIILFCAQIKFVTLEWKFGELVCLVRRTKNKAKPSAFCLFTFKRLT